MSKILKRPMFRKGGNVGNGIMTGIVDRENHAVNPLVGDLKQIIPTTEEMAAFRAAAPKRPETEYKSFDPLTRFLLTFGPAYATETRGSGTIGRALAASQEPFAQMIAEKDEQIKQKREREREKYLTESELFTNLMSAKADVLSEAAGGAGDKTYKDIIVGEEINKLVPRIAEIQTLLQDESLKDADKIKLQNELEAAKINLQRYRKSDPEKVALLDLFVRSKEGEDFISNTMDRLKKADEKGERKYTSDDDPKLLQDALEEARSFITQIRTGSAEGGRIGYQDGTPNPMNTSNEQPITYEQLRARLPKEITNDIVTLMANSAEALEDFAMISTQQDVDNFNKKFNVNLVLPAEA